MIEVQQKCCKDCGQTLPLKSFPYRKPRIGKGGGYGPRCIECQKSMTASVDRTIATAWLRQTLDSMGTERRIETRHSRSRAWSSETGAALSESGG